MLIVFKAYFGVFQTTSDYKKIIFDDSFSQVPLQILRKTGDEYVFQTESWR